MQDAIEVKGQKTDGGGAGKHRQNVHGRLSKDDHAHQIGDAEIRIAQGKAVYSVVELFQGNPSVQWNISLFAMLTLSIIPAFPRKVTHYFRISALTMEKNRRIRAEAAFRFQRGGKPSDVN